MNSNIWYITLYSNNYYSDSVAVCSGNRYSIDSYGTASLTCDVFETENCESNEDLPVTLNSQKLSSAFVKGEILEKEKNLGGIRTTCTSVVFTLASIFWFL